MWIQGGKKETWLREMYDEAVNGIIENMLSVSDSGLAFLADWNGRTTHRKMDHLVCFFPGSCWACTLDVDDESSMVIGL